MPPTTNPDVKGLYLLSDYPAVTVQPGTTSTVTLHLHNYALPPERLSLSVAGVPTGWTATLLGGGQPVAAAMPATDEGVSLDLRLDVPKDAAIGTHTLTVSADGGTSHITLPVAVTLAKELPAKLTLQPQLPELRGSSRSSFDYTMTIKNDSGKKLLVSLAADAPRNFDTSFTEAYGSQQLTAIPVDAGKTKDIKLKVTPARHRRCRPLSSDRACRRRGRQGRGQGRARHHRRTQARRWPAARACSAPALPPASETSVPVIVTNTGTAPAENVQLSASAPSGWKITFDPKTIDRIAPNQHKEVQARDQPAGQRHRRRLCDDASQRRTRGKRNANFRVTVATSTNGASPASASSARRLLIMVGAVTRFGRR